MCPVASLGHGYNRISVRIGEQKRSRLNEWFAEGREERKTKASREGGRRRGGIERVTYSINEWKNDRFFNCSFIGAVTFFLDCVSDFCARAVILETNHSGFWEFNKLSKALYFFFSMPPLTREADLDISDSETKQENKLQIIRTLGIKTQNPGFRTGHSLGNAC